MTAPIVPASIDDPLNVAVLAIAEDRLEGFQPDPLGEISRRSGVPLPLVVERIQAMVRAGTIRRVRQTLTTTSLAPGALAAWKVPPQRLEEAFDYMFGEDPFSGHIVIRSTDAATTGGQYRLWTTLKVPQGFSLRKHAAYLAERVGAESFRLMPAKRLFALGVGHTRRRTMQPGSRAETPAAATETKVVQLNDLEWRVLAALKREFEVEEIVPDLWRPRAAEATVPLERFYAVARGLEEKGVTGRFSTFLEHAKPLYDGQRVTRYNALFHWAVPTGKEIDAGREVGRHHIVTHAYWREAGPDFGNVNIMAVVHGMEKELVLSHKEAIDAHLASVGIPISYTNVFWGGRSEIKPSEVLPTVYREWCERVGLDPASMRDGDGEQGAM